MDFWYFPYNIMKKNIVVKKKYVEVANGFHMSKP